MTAEKRVRASSTSEELAFNQGRAGEELMRGCDVMSKLRALLLLGLMEEPLSMAAGVLLDELSNSFGEALSILQIERQPDLGSHFLEGGSHCSQAQKKRRIQQSWTTITTAPFHDGHQWRKYGEKKIQSAKYPRSYYRCTHKDDQGCPAMKRVQQNNCYDPPEYLVTYNNEHTCKGDPIHPQLVVDCSPSEPYSLNFNSAACEADQMEHLLSSFATTKSKPVSDTIGRKTEPLSSFDHHHSSSLTTVESIETTSKSSDDLGIEYGFDELWSGTFEVDGLDLF